MADKFMFFENFKETADRLPDDLRLKFYDAMTDYVFKGIEPDDAVISALITAIKPSLDKEDKRGGNHNPLGQNQWSNVVKEVKNGQTRSKEVNPLETETENKENNTLKGITKEKNFRRPTIEEITNYCLDRKNGVNAEKFYDFYESKGWKVGKSPMKDWRAAVRNWERGSDCGQPAVTAANDVIISVPDPERERMAAIIEATKRANERRMIEKYGV